LPIAYQEPSTGPVATITYKNASSKNLSIALFNQSEECTGRRGLKIIEPGDQRTIKVRAGEDLTFEYNMSVGHKYCRINLRFAPRDGAVYQFNTIDDPEFCLWRMLAMTTGQPQPVRLQQIPWNQGSDENSSFCNEVEYERAL